MRDPFAERMEALSLSPVIEPEPSPPAAARHQHPVIGTPTSIMIAEFERARLTQQSCHDIAREIDRLIGREVM